MSLVVSNLARDFDTLSLQALAQVPFAHVIELRFDLVRDPGELRLRELFSRLGRPVIVAVNGPEALGHFDGSRAERFAILRSAAAAGAAFVDVDWREAHALGSVPRPCRRIVSRHETERTPEDLPLALRELSESARPADRLKLVAHAHAGEDGVRLLELARTSERDLIAFATGEKGSFTRVLAPIFGSPFTYSAPVHVEGAPRGKATAPGQLCASSLRACWPRNGVTRATEIFAVLGRPARHSFSPRVHCALFRHFERDAVHVAIEPDDMPSFIRLCEADNWRGFSVTAPFKEKAYDFSLWRDEYADECRAANTLMRHDDGSWEAWNTDAIALEEMLTRHLEDAGKIVAEAHVAVLGTGGAARAAIVAARRAGAARITVAGRDESKRVALARELSCQPCPIEALEDIAFDALVHCTPLGSSARLGEMPLDARALRSGVVVIDAVYRPRRTALLDAAERAGAKAVSGSEWFARQAACQAHKFAGANAKDAREVIEDELERALAEEEMR